MSKWGGLNVRSSMENWAAETLLGLEVTLRTEKTKILVTVSSAGVTDVCWAQAFPPPPLCSDLVLELNAAHKRGKEGRLGRGTL